MCRPRASVRARVRLRARTNCRARLRLRTDPVFVAHVVQQHAADLASGDEGTDEVVVELVDALEVPGWRDGGMEGWRDGGMEGWRDGGVDG